MKNKSAPSMKAVLELQSAILLELLLTRHLTQAESDAIKTNTRALLTIVFNTKDVVSNEVAIVDGEVDDQPMAIDGPIKEESFYRPHFTTLLEHIDVNRLTLADLDTLYNSAKANNQFINFIDLVLQYHIIKENNWLTESLFQCIIKEAIESHRLSDDDFQLILNKLVIHFICAHKSVIQDIIHFACAFGKPNHIKLVTDFYDKINSELVEVKLPEGCLFGTKPLGDQAINSKQDKENIENMAVEAHPSPNGVSSFGDF